MHRIIESPMYLPAILLLAAASDEIVELLARLVGG